MRSTFHHIVCGFLALCLLCSLNAHLPVLQVAAWARMIVKFSAQEDFASAIRDTFDGEHPCKMCRVIKKETTRSQESLKAAPVLKTDLLLVHVAMPVPPPLGVRLAFQPMSESRDVFSSPPEVPPPCARARSFA
jgi:hypothetical protein